jgi:hypothetical protein
MSVRAAFAEDSDGYFFIAKKKCTVVRKHCVILEVFETRILPSTWHTNR